MTERRYSDEEVAQIFDRATEAQKSTLPAARSAEGLSLAELQEVGKEVGLPPELVARAARSLDAKGKPEGRMVVGLEVGVGRTVELDRPLTEAEWNRLVVDLRETFDAPGKVSEHGQFKQWTNGNLQALLEPTPTGQRFRLKTFKASAMGMMRAGLGMLGVTSAILTVLYLRGQPFFAGGLWPTFFVGLGLLVVGALQVPGWAKLRKRQIEELTERLAIAVASSPADDSAKRNPGSS
jgi:hypothetical protein